MPSKCMSILTRERQCKYTSTVYTIEKGGEYLHYQPVRLPDKEVFSVVVILLWPSRV